MTTLTLFLVVLIALEHLGIMLIEMFAGPKTQARTFDMPLNFVSQTHTRTALANQGIYNGALALLIIFSLFIFNGAMLMAVIRLFMIFIMIVGAYGGLTVTRKIFIAQLLPATIILILSFL